MDKNFKSSDTCTLEIHHKDGQKITVKNVREYSWSDNHLIIIGNEYNTAPAMNITFVKQIEEEQE